MNPNIKAWMDMTRVLQNARRILCNPDMHVPVSLLHIHSGEVDGYFWA